MSPPSVTPPPPPPPLISLSSEREREREKGGAIHTVFQRLWVEDKEETKSNVISTSPRFVSSERREKGGLRLSEREVKGSKEAPWKGFQRKGKEKRREKKLDVENFQCRKSEKCARKALSEVSSPGCASPGRGVNSLSHPQWHSTRRVLPLPAVTQCRTPQVAGTLTKERTSVYSRLRRGHLSRNTCLLYI